MRPPVSGSRSRGRLLLLIALLIAVGLNVAFVLPDAGAPAVAAQGPSSPALLIPDANGNDCGNHNCQENKGETCQSCPADCGYCTPPPPPPPPPTPPPPPPSPTPFDPGCVPHDGNGYCDPECEASWNAPLDCGTWCGDTVCAEAERGTCVQDCGEMSLSDSPPIEQETVEEEQGSQGQESDMDNHPDPTEDQEEDKSPVELQPAYEEDHDDTSASESDAVEPSQDADQPAVIEPTQDTVTPPSLWEKLVEMSKAPLFFVVVLIVVILFGTVVLFLVLHAADEKADAAGSDTNRRA
ncbi:MAG: hypothetical protein Kow00124_32360 [Anaerolineae bacterium]